jgi:hypothetical protein
MESNQITWTHKELVTLMIKEAKIHEGRWLLLLQYGMSPGNFGPSPAEISPGMVVAVTRIGIQREPPGQVPAPEGLVVDAAEANPAQSEERAADATTSAPPGRLSPQSPPVESRRPTRRRGA